MIEKKINDFSNYIMSLSDSYEKSIINSNDFNQLVVDHCKENNLDIDVLRLKEIITIENDGYFIRELIHELSNLLSFDKSSLIKSANGILFIKRQESVQELLFSIGWIFNVPNKERITFSFFSKVLLKNISKKKGEHFYIPKSKKRDQDFYDLIFKCTSVFSDNVLTDSNKVLKLIVLEQLKYLLSNFHKKSYDLIDLLKVKSDEIEKVKGLYVHKGLITKYDLLYLFLPVLLLLEDNNDRNHSIKKSFNILGNEIKIVKGLQVRDDSFVEINEITRVYDRFYRSAKSFKKRTNDYRHFIEGNKFSSLK